MALDEKHWTETFAKLSTGCAVFSFLVGLTVLAGWLLDVPVLKSVSPAWVTMKANTAACFMLLGVALGVQTIPVQRLLPSSGSVSRPVVLVASGLALLTGLLTLFEYLAGINIGIDQLLFVEAPGAVYTSHPGRMAPNTALSFVVTGLAVLLLDAQFTKVRAPAQLLALLQAAIALFALVGYLYGVSEFYGLAAYTKMAMHTAGTLLVLALGLLCARPDRGLMAVATTDTAGGLLMRRFLPPLILFLGGLGWLRLMGQRLGLYSTELGIALHATASIVFVAFLVHRLAGTIHRMEIQRRRSEEDVRRLNAALEGKVLERTAALQAVAEALRRERDFTAAVVDTIGALIVVLDPEGRIVRFNRACAQVTGYTFPEVRDRAVWDFLLVPEERESVRAVFLKLRSGDYPLSHENYWLTRDGQRRRIMWANTCIANPDGSIRFVIGTGIDVTEQRAAEAALQQAYLELEQRVQQRTADLAAANRELEAFTYSVSHDLRAPLQSMEGFAGALQEEVGSTLPPEAQDYLTRIRRAGQRMKELIDALLRLSRVSRASMQREDVNLTTLARTIAHNLQQQAPQRSVAWMIGEGLQAEGDAALLQIALENLLGNAWKFTARQPQPRIEFDVGVVPAATEGGPCRRPVNACLSCATTASVLTKRGRADCSGPLSVCTARTSFPVPAWGWPLYSALLSVTAAASGLKGNPVGAPPFTSRCRSRLRPRHRGKIVVDAPRPLCECVALMKAKVQPLANAPQVVLVLLRLSGLRRLLVVPVDPRWGGG